MSNSIALNDENASVGDYSCRNSVSGKGRTKPSSFNRLLRDATNQVREEIDTQVAVDCTVNEALEVMQDWAREVSDQEFAKKLQYSLKEEEERARRAELETGEAAALKVAIEETRRVKAQAKDKEAREQSDALYAKAVYEAEEKEAKLAKKLREEEDEKIAHEILRSEQQLEHKAESKDSFSDSPADSKSSSFEWEAKADVKHAQRSDEDDETFYRTVSAKFAQLDADLELAQREQSLIDESVNAERRKQLEKDFELSRRLAIKTEREAHRIRKLKAMEADFEKSQRDPESIAKLWEIADAEVDDVCNAVCITVLLPNIVRLDVRVVKNGSKVAIDALRFVPNEENDQFSNLDNTRYLAEFKIQGKNIQVTDKSVSHEYSSETGLLHIYIEGVSLVDNNCSETAQNNGSQKSKGESDRVGDSFDKSMSFHVPSTKTLAQSLKNGFMRLFRANNESTATTVDHDTSQKTVYV